MSLYILSFIVFFALFCAMSIGVIMGRSPIKGSCGGMSALGLDTECEICGGNPARCENQVTTAPREAVRELSYDAALERPAAADGDTSPGNR